MISDRSAGRMIAIVTIMIGAAIASTFGPQYNSTAEGSLATASMLTPAVYTEARD